MNSASPSGRRLSTSFTSGTARGTRGKGEQAEYRLRLRRSAKVSEQPTRRPAITVPDANDGQRAREIFDAIRQRLGETTLPAYERDYLERLLEQF